MKKTAVLFPRQGTQAWGMGKELYNKLFETDSTEIMDTGRLNCYALSYPVISRQKETIGL